MVEEDRSGGVRTVHDEAAHRSIIRPTALYWMVAGPSSASVLCWCSTQTYVVPATVAERQGVCRVSALHRERDATKPYLLGCCRLYASKSEYYGTKHSTRTDTKEEGKVADDK